MTKRSLYDFLEVSKSVSEEMLGYAYQNKREKLLSQDLSNEDVKNSLLILDEAWRTLSDPDKRKAYDLKLLVDERPAIQTPIYAYENDNYPQRSIFLEWWDGSKMSKILIAFGVFVAIVLVYQFNANQKRVELEQRRLAIEHQKVEAIAAREAERVLLEKRRLEQMSEQAERAQLQQDRLYERQLRTTDRSLDLASRREDRADRRLETDSAVTGAMIQMDRERLQMEKDRQARAERERQRRDAESVHYRNKAELCRIYEAQNLPWAVRGEGCR